MKIDGIYLDTFGPIAAVIISVMLIGLPLRKAILDYNEEEKRYNESPLTTGTVVEKNEANGAYTFSIDTDGNKDTIEKVIKISKKGKYVPYTENMKEGSRIQFKNLKGKNLNLESIYQIDDFIVRKR